MPPTVDGERELPSRPRRRLVRLTAVGVTVGVAAAAMIGSSGATAAAATLPQAQAVGRFLDGTAGGSPIQSLADLKDARAKAAPNTSSRNPLEADVLKQLKVPLGDSLKLPGGGAFSLGAANQLAEARTNGFSYGAAGAVANTGGVDLTDKQGAFPSNATIDLSSDLLGSVAIPGLPTSGLPGLPSIPGLPNGSGTTSLAALGGVKATIGAVRALAQTKVGGKVLTPQSSVASVNLAVGSPALGGLLTQLKALLNPSTLSGALSAIPGLSTLLALLPSSADVSKCALTATTPSNIYLDSTGKKATAANSAVTIDVTDATININLGVLVQKLLGKDISNLSTSNFDLISFLVKQLPAILSTGLEGTITGITDSLSDQFSDCTALLGPLGSVADTVLGLIRTGQSTLLGAINGVTGQLNSASDAPLSALASGLKNLIDVGLNVQSGPGIEKHDKTYPFESDLAATPNQATSVVKNQTLVRAIEIDLLDVSGLPAAGGTLPGLPTLPATNSARSRQLAGSPQALAAPGDGAAVLALANAAAGPSTNPTVVAPSPSPSNPGTPTTGVPAVPTGVPAGAAGHLDGGSPAMPIVLVLLGLLLAGGGVTAYRFRGKFSH